MPTAWPITMATAYVVARREGGRYCEITQDDGAIGEGGWAAHRRDGCQRGLPRRARRPYTAPTPWRCGWAPKRRAMPTHRSHRARPPGWCRVQRWRKRTACRCEWHHRATRRQGERRVQHRACRVGAGRAGARAQNETCKCPARAVSRHSDSRTSDGTCSRAAHRWGNSQHGLGRGLAPTFGACRTSTIAP